MRQAKFEQIAVEGRVQSVLWELKCAAQQDAVIREFERWKAEKKQIGEFDLQSVTLISEYAVQTAQLVLYNKSAGLQVLNVRFSLAQKYHPVAEGEEAPVVRAHYYIPLDTYFSDEDYAPDGQNKEPYAITSLCQVADLASRYPKQALLGIRPSIGEPLVQGALDKESPMPLNNMPARPISSGPNVFRERYDVEQAKRREEAQIREERERIARLIDAERARASTHGMRW